MTSPAVDTPAGPNTAETQSDLMIPTPLSHLMAGLIPDARIRIYPDAAHGFLFQYPAEVSADVNAFLADQRP